MSKKTSEIKLEDIEIKKNKFKVMYKNDTQMFKRKLRILKNEKQIEMERAKNNITLYLPFMVIVMTIITFIFNITKTTNNDLLVKWSIGIIFITLVGYISYSLSLYKVYNSRSIVEIIALEELIEESEEKGLTSES